MRLSEFASKTKFFAKHKRRSKVVDQNLDEEQLDELTFLGSQCTKDCSGHRAGYEWSQQRGGQDAASHSPSFNKGAWLYKNGY